MCGIAGAFGLVSDHSVAAVTAMGLAQRHRGPDGDGQWSGTGPVPGQGVVLAHRRLSIIDLSAAGAQPMHDPVTGNVVVFNGEIYNFADVKKTLATLGHAFVSDCDTEVILKAYSEWGLDCLQRFRGMFAFALWDVKTGQLHLVRDRLGVKPLYFARVSDPADPTRKLLLFASEVRALLASGLVGNRLDPEGVRSFLWNGFVVGPATIVAGVRLLDAASIMTLSGPSLAEASTRRYWSMPAASRDPRIDAGSIHETLRDSVRLRLIADVPVGIFLSGGIDSSAVAALASEVAPGNLSTFNIGFEHAALDESRYASAVAKTLDTRHTGIVLTESMFQQQIDAALASIDQPTFDGINSYFVSRAVKEAGITVALAGTGGDELFGGYRSFVELPRAHRLLARLPGIGPAASGLLRVLAAASADAGRARVPSQQRWGKLLDVLATGGDLLRLYQVSYSLFTRNFQDQLAGADLAATDTGYGLPGGAEPALRELATDPELLHAVSRLELAQFIGQRLLRDVDSTSMAVSLEVREPLLDHVLMESLAAMDQKTRFAPLRSKQLLRSAALRGIDPAIFDRPKSGFELPIARWLERDLGRRIEETLSDEAAVSAAGLEPAVVRNLWSTYRNADGKVYWSRPWALFVLVDYARRYGLSV